MEQRARDVVKLGDKLFEAKRPVDNLWQEIALNFYPERADFTAKRNEGEEFSDHLFSSFPVLARRELGNVLSSYLYSRSQKRFSIHVADDELDKGDAERAFLERLTDIQWKAMYDAPAMLSDTMKMTGHDFAGFGNAVIKYGLNSAGDGLLFRNYHLRDNAWSENAEGKIDCDHRNWEPTARQLGGTFPKTISKEVTRALTKDPEKTFKCRHVVLPSRIYKLDSKGGKRFAFTSMYVECESEQVLEEVGLNYFCYVIPRWHKVSKFGSSMATSIALPDGRTQQVVIRTLREAGEKFADPPTIGVGDAIRGDIALQAGGHTNVDAEYDERLGEVLRPLTQDKGGFPIAVEIAQALREDIRSAFFLDKIQLPETGKEMTAYEMRRRFEEHIRAQTPIFDPIEEQVAPLYEGVFDLLRDNNAFPIGEMPESLDNSDVKFSFFSPLSDMADQRDAEIYLDVRDRIIGPAAQIDPSQLEQVDWTEATRDAMRAGGWKAKWFKPKDAVEKRQQEMAKAAAMQKGAEALATAGTVAEQGGKGMKEIQEAMGGPVGG